MTKSSRCPRGPLDRVRRFGPRGVTTGLPQAAGELLPGLVDEREGSAVAVGGVAYQDRAVTAGGLYTVSLRGLTPLAHVLPSLSVIAADSDARWLSARRLSNILVRVER
jgi:hypothetical protein